MFAPTAYWEDWAQKGKHKGLASCISQCSPSDVRLVTFGAVSGDRLCLRGPPEVCHQMLNQAPFSDAKGLSNPAEVETLREKVYATLEAYTKQKYPEQPGR